MITGACVSLTITVKLQGVAALPAASVTVQVTVVTPFGKEEPVGWVCKLLLKITNEEIEKLLPAA